MCCNNNLCCFMIWVPDNVYDLSVFGFVVNHNVRNYLKKLRRRMTYFRETSNRSDGLSINILSTRCHN